MDAVEYAEWTALHLTLFCLDAEAHGPLFREWFVAGLRHCSLADLSEASRWLCASGEGRFRQDHLAKLLARVKIGQDAQRKKRQAEEDENAARMTCGVCAGIGAVCVPAPACLRDGEWVYPFSSVAVSCRCPRGLRRQDKLNEFRDEAQKPRFTSLADYELRYPDWAQVMLDRENRRKDEAEAEARAKRLDRTLGPLDVAKLKERLAERMKAS